MGALRHLAGTVPDRECIAAAAAAARLGCRLRRHDLDAPTRAGRRLQARPARPARLARLANGAGEGVPGLVSGRRGWMPRRRLEALLVGAALALFAWRELA